MNAIIFKIENQKNLNDVLINLIKTKVQVEVELFLYRIKNEKTNQPKAIFVTDVTPQKHYNINTIQINFNVVFDFVLFIEKKSFNKVLQLSYVNDYNTNEGIKRVLDVLKLEKETEEIEQKAKKLEAKLIEEQKEKELQTKLEIKENFLFDFITKINNSYLLKLKENGFKQWLGLAEHSYAETVLNELGFIVNSEADKIEYQPNEKELDFFVDCKTKILNSEKNNSFILNSCYFSRLDNELYFEGEVTFLNIDKTFYCIKKVNVK